MTTTRLCSVLTGLLLAAALWLPVRAFAAGPVKEAHCTELGSVCACSEPLREAPGSSLINPETTTGVTQCNGGNAIDATTGLAWIAMSSVVGEQIAGVEYVLQANNTDGVLHSGAVDFTGETYCVRIYEQFQTGYQPPDHDGPPSCGGNCERVKDFRFHSCQTDPPTIFDHPGFQTSSAAGCNGFGSESSCAMDFYPGAYNGSIFGEQTPSWDVPLTFDQMIGRWVRLEICFDHYPTGHPTYPEQLRTRGRWVRVDGGGQGSFNALHTGTSPTASVNLSGPGQCADFALNLTTPDFVPSPGNRYASHVMTALTASVDDTFWIGAASEMESAQPASPASIAGGAISGGSIHAP